MNVNIPMNVLKCSAVGMVGLEGFRHFQKCTFSCFAFMALFAAPLRACRVAVAVAALISLSASITLQALEGVRL